MVGLTSHHPLGNKHVNIREFMLEMHPNTATLTVAHGSQREKSDGTVSFIGCIIGGGGG